MHDKFKKSNNVVMNNLIYQKYIMRDAINRRKFREYAQKIIRFVKNVDMINVQNRLNLIYNDINIDVRNDDFRRFKTIIFLNDMLSDLNEFKHD